MRRLLIVSLLLSTVGVAFAVGKDIIGIFNIDPNGGWEVFLPGVKVERGLGKAQRDGKGVAAAIGQQVPNPAVPKCKAAVTLVHAKADEVEMGQFYGLQKVYLCEGKPKAGRIYAGAWYESSNKNTGEITIKDEAALQKLIGWPAK